MKINTSALRSECDARGWKVTSETDRFMIQSDRASVSCVGNLGGEARLYANGTMREVVRMVQAIAKCEEA